MSVTILHVKQRVPALPAAAYSTRGAMGDRRLGTVNHWVQRAQAVGRVRQDGGAAGSLSPQALVAGRWCRWRLWHPLLPALLALLAA